MRILVPGKKKKGIEEVSFLSWNDQLELMERLLRYKVTPLPYQEVRLFVWLYFETNVYKIRVKYLYHFLNMTE